MPMSIVADIIVRLPQLLYSVINRVADDTWSRICIPQRVTAHRRTFARRPFFTHLSNQLIISNSVSSTDSRAKY